VWSASVAVASLNSQYADQFVSASAHMTICVCVQAPSYAAYLLWVNILAPWIFAEPPEVDEKKTKKLDRKMRRQQWCCPYLFVSVFVSLSVCLSFSVSMCVVGVSLKVHFSASCFSVPWTVSLEWYCTDSWQTRQCICLCVAW